MSFVSPYGTRTMIQHGVFFSGVGPTHTVSARGDLQLVQFCWLWSRVRADGVGSVNYNNNHISTTLTQIIP